TRCGPASNERLAVAPVASSKTPSPLRSHSCLTTLPSGSLDDDVKVTVSPAVGDVGLTEKTATGLWLATTTTFAVEVVTAPRSSVTRSPTGSAPGAVNLRVAVAPV